MPLELSDKKMSLARKTLAADERSRRLIIKANEAVLDAVRSLALDYKNPIATNLFGISQEDLEVLAKAGPSKLGHLPQIGIPFFSLRLGTPEIRQLLVDPNPSPEALLQLLLKTFSESIPLSSL